MDVKKLWKYRHLTFLGIVLIFSLWIRTKTFSNEYVQTSADPWWFYRLTEDLIKNHYKPPEWDRLSHALPGRPGYPWMGLPYFTVLVHMILNLFGDYSLMYACNVVPLILVCLTGIFAYLLGKEFSNNWGGIATAVFILTSPTIVAISTAGYFETDIVTVLGTFACMFFLFLAFRKRSISSLILAVLSNILFVYSWNTGYYALFMFSGFVFFSILENLVQKKYMDAKSDVKFLLVITLPVFIISYLLGVNIFFYFFQRINSYSPFFSVPHQYEFFQIFFSHTILFLFLHSLKIFGNILQKDPFAIKGFKIKPAVLFGKTKGIGRSVLLKKLFRDFHQSPD